MRYLRGAVITGRTAMAVRDDCPVPEEPCATGALIRPLIWSPCTSDAHLCATGCASLPYLLGKAVGHEMCGEITKVGPEVKDFRVGDRVIVCSGMPVWRSLEAQDGMAKQRQDNLYTGVGRLLCGGILHPRRGHEPGAHPRGRQPGAGGDGAGHDVYRF